MKPLRRVVIGIEVVFLTVAIYALIDILTNGLLRQGAIKYISIIIAIAVPVFIWDYLDKLIEKKSKK